MSSLYQPEKKPRTRLSVETAIARAQVTWKPDADLTPMRYNSAFWTAVFTARYGRKPKGLTDPLWDVLFKAGLKKVPLEGAVTEK